MAEDEKDSCEEKKEKGSFFNACFGPVGIKTEGKWYNIRITGRFFVITGVMFFLFFAFMIFMFNYSTRPEFCTTCHIMDPYYKAWKTSTHQKVATCVDCHYPKNMGVLPQKMRAMSQLVQYVTRTYRPRPQAEVPDQNCLQPGCHETRLLQGKIVTKNGINFDHTPHLTQVRRGKQLQRTSCHSQIVIGSHIEVTYSTCYLCHFKGFNLSRNEMPLGGCTSCHAAPSKPVTLSDGGTFNHADYVQRPGVKCVDCHLDAISGDGIAPKERCYDCHNVPERIEQYANVDFVHKNHVAEHKVPCSGCHLAIEHKVGVAKPTPGSCAQCHNTKHDAAAKMYAGQWPDDSKVQPAAMASVHVQCIACHVNMPGPDSTGPDHFAPPADACNRCHGEGFADMLAQWNSDIDKSVGKIEKKIAALEAVLKTLPEKDPGRDKIETLLQDARRSVSFTKIGMGVHNYDLASEHLTHLNKTLDEAMSTPQ